MGHVVSKTWPLEQINKLGLLLWTVLTIFFVQYMGVTFGPKTQGQHGYLIIWVQKLGIECFSLYM